MSVVNYRITLNIAGERFDESVIGMEQIKVGEPVSATTILDKSVVVSNRGYKQTTTTFTLQRGGSAHLKFENLSKLKTRGGDTSLDILYRDLINDTVTDVEKYKIVAVGDVYSAGKVIDNPQLSAENLHACYDVILRKITNSSKAN